MKGVYLDHAATTPLRPEVRAAMAPYLEERFGNPSSTHRWGRQARNALEEARERVAAGIGAGRREIVFTSGGTEADNIAVLGRWRHACRSAPGGDRVGGAVVCSAVEHKAVLAAAQAAAAEGAKLIILGCDEEGRVDLGALHDALAAEPCVVSVMWANNEVGTIQPVAEVAEGCRRRGVVFHTDAVQAFGKLAIDVNAVGCDLLSLSAHKVGGPKGVGALYVRESTSVLPLAHGGGQERELRPGTENVAAAVGMAAAVTLMAEERERITARMIGLRDLLESGLTARLPGLVVNGSREFRLPNLLNVTVPGVDQEELLIALDLEGVAVSGGSACQSGIVRPSHVLTAMGATRPGGANVRFSVGWDTTLPDVEHALAAFDRVMEQLRAEAAF